jgi:hypothetical protein
MIAGMKGVAYPRAPGPVRRPGLRAAEGYDRMMSGKARFRVVLTTR